MWQWQWTWGNLGTDYRRCTRLGHPSWRRGYCADWKKACRMLSLGSNPNPNLNLDLNLCLCLLRRRWKGGRGERARARRLGGGRRHRLRALVALCGASRDSRHSCNAGQRCKGSKLSSQRLSGEPLAFPAGADSIDQLGRLSYYPISRCPFAAFSDVRGTIHPGILIHDYALYELLHDDETKGDVASPLIYRPISQIDEMRQVY